MIRFPCCCCFSCENSNESQPLLASRQSEKNETASARQTLSGHSEAQTTQRSGKLVMRRVGVADLDQRFSDVAETFNEQQHRFETTVRLLHSLQKRYSCSQCGTLALSEVLRKMRDEHENYRIFMRLKGYDFTLCVIPASAESENEPLPYPLLRAVDGIKDISDSAKAAISKGTALQELVGWLIRSKDQMADQVRGAAETFQEQGRLTENLKENMREVVRAKELSLEYRQKAGELFIEAADIAGPHL